MKSAVRKKRKRRRKVVVLWKRVRGVMFGAYPLPGKEASEDPEDWVPTLPYIVGNDGHRYRVSWEEYDNFYSNREDFGDMSIFAIDEKRDKEKVTGVLVSFETPVKPAGRWRWAYNLKLAKERR